MLTAVRGEPTAAGPAALGLPQGEREGRAGCPARPGAGAAAAAGRARLRGRYARAGERRSAAPGAGTACGPQRLELAPGCWTPVDITHRKTSRGCRMRLSLVVLFPWWMAVVALESPSCCNRLGHLGFGAEDLCKGRKCGYESSSSAGLFLVGFAAASSAQPAGCGAFVLSPKPWACQGCGQMGRKGQDRGKRQDGEVLLCRQRPSLPVLLITVSYLVSASRTGLILIQGKDERPQVPHAREPRSGWHWPRCLCLVP